MFEANVRCLAAKKASISSVKSIDSSVSKIISIHHQIMTAGESALLLDEEAVVSRIITLILGKLCDRIYHTPGILRALLYFDMVSFDEKTGERDRLYVVHTVR